MKCELKAILLVVLIVLAGYHELFLGANFFIDEDVLTDVHNAHGCAVGNGWRSDKGLGVSLFFGDPGLQHAWAPFVLWEKIIGDPFFAFQASVLILILIAAVVQYGFLRSIAPGLGPYATALLAPLIIFGPLQYEFILPRAMIGILICTPLFILLLHEYYAAPRPPLLFGAAVILWFSLYLSSSYSFEVVCVSGILFTLLYWIWHRPPLGMLAKRCASVYIFAGVWTVLLGAWIAYPLWLEPRVEHYVREPNYLVTGWFDLKAFVDTVFNLFHSGWFTSQVPLLGSPEYFFPISWGNVTVIMPILLAVVLLRRSETFWEFSFKWMVVIMTVHCLLSASVPAYFNGLQKLVNKYPLTKLEPAYHSFQLALLALVLSAGAGTILPARRAVRGARLAVAAFLVFFYAALASVATAILFAPAALESALAGAVLRFAPASVAGYSCEVLAEVVRINIAQMQRGMHWHSLAFYVSSAIMAAVFLKEGWLRRSLALRPVAMAGILLVNGILLSWSIYPLNTRSLVWDAVQPGLPPPPRLEPTDRLYYFFDPVVQKTQKTVESLRQNWLEGEFGPREERFGYRNTPALNLSDAKSFVQRDVAEFTMHMFNGDGKERIKCLRDLLFGNAFLQSELMDMCAVTHYYCFREYPAPESYPLFFRSKQFFMYKNPRAWPYYYLARLLDIKPDGKHLSDVEPGTGYVAKEDMFALRPDTAARLTLTNFTYGDMTFEYSSTSEEFLVVADAWHPFWKAAVDGAPAAVVKANEIFKGVRLPAGAHSIRLYYDTTAYRPGIWIAIGSWIVFVIAWVIVQTRFSLAASRREAVSGRPA